MLRVQLLACGIAYRRLHYMLRVAESIIQRPHAVWEGSHPVSESPRPLDALEQTIAARAASSSEKSYTSQLLAGGVERIGAKVIEEAAEVVEAAGEPGDAGREHLIREAADLIFHLLVLLQHGKCSLADVEAELARRFGVSGLEERASRKKQGE